MIKDCSGEYEDPVWLQVSESQVGISSDPAIQDSLNQSLHLDSLVLDLQVQSLHWSIADLHIWLGVFVCLS